ncbi:MAG: nucleotidyltransferase family protein [Kiritimatiellia bacterium]
MRDTPIFNSPELTTAQRDFLRVLRAAANGTAPGDAPADWAALLGLAAAHQVDGYLYTRVHTWEAPFQPPAALMTRWRSAFLGEAARYTRVALQTRDLLAALHAAGVGVIPLKGAWLAERVYEDGACRPMSDIDLLVSAESLPRARAAVESIGYATTDFYMDEARSKHVRYRKADAPLPLELHWRLWHENSENIDEPDPAHVWTGLREERLHGVPVLVFPPERQLAHLAQHILAHGLTVPLKAYLDLILLIQRYAPTMELARLEDEARAWRVAFGTKFVLRVAGDIGEIPLPPALAAYVNMGGQFEEARRAALTAALQLTGESKRLTPSLQACRGASLLARLRIGITRVFLAPADIRSGHPQAVRRWGLAGGYLCRGADLLRRHGQALRKLSGGGDAVDAHFANYAARRALSAWIRAKEGRQPPATGCSPATRSAATPPAP